MKHLVLLSTCFLACYAAAAAAAPGVYAFGDSALEQGNFFTLPDGVGKAAAPPSPPYFSRDGFIRDSNGPVWVEIAYPGIRPVRAGSPYGRRVNFGFDGARTGTGSINPGGEGTGVRSQVEMFERLKRDHELFPEPDDIFVIDAGPNDVFYALFIGKSDPKAAARQGGENLASAALDLIRDGARHVFVNDFADTGLAPVFDYLPPWERKAAIEASAVGSVALHAAIAKKNAQLGYGGIILLPSRSVVETLISHPDLYGFQNVTASCYTDDKSPLCAHSLDGQNRFLFWDLPGHPTVAGQRLLATLYLGTINSIRQDK